MSSRSRYRGALLVLLLLVVAAAWGCGGDPGESTPSITAAAPLSGAPTTAVGQNGTERLVGTQLKATTETPEEYVEAVKAAQPIVLLFYLPSGVDDQKVLDNVRNLQPSFSDYTFLLYDCSDPVAYGDLTTLLKIDYPPAVVLVDSTGTIDRVWNGYVDEGTLNQNLVNLRMAPGAPTTFDDSTGGA